MTALADLWRPLPALVLAASLTGGVAGAAEPLRFKDSRVELTVSAVSNRTVQVVVAPLDEKETARPALDRARPARPVQPASPWYPVENTRPPATATGDTPSPRPPPFQAKGGPSGGHPWSSPVSADTLDRSGPRHCGQSAAGARVTNANRPSASKAILQGGSGFCVPPVCCCSSVLNHIAFDLPL
jgi:hypothetical protein